MVDFTATTQPRSDQIVELIRATVSPELILLFGSRARGDARPDSDFDILLVLRDGADVQRERLAATSALRTAGISADVLASSVSDYQRHQHDPGFLDWLVSREGLLLYSAGTLPQRSPRPARVREELREGLEMWIQRANEDFRIAARSIAAADPERGAICFHAHACVEKLLKAMIVKAGTHPRHAHELSDLRKAQRQDIREDGALVAACDLLDSLYPQSRYPEEPMPTLDEAQRAFDAARAVRDRLLPILSAADTSRSTAPSPRST